MEQTSSRMHNYEYRFSSGGNSIWEFGGAYRPKPKPKPKPVSYMSQHYPIEV